MTLAERMNMQRQPTPQPSSKQVNVVIHMPEVAGLIKHLDLLYTKMLMNNNEQQQTQQVSWFNPGQGIKQSASVN